MESLADAVCLRMARLRLGVPDAVYAQKQLVVMGFELAAIFRAPVVSIRTRPISCEAKNGNTLPFNRSAPVMGIFVLYNLAAAGLEPP